MDEEILLDYEESDEDTSDRPKIDEKDLLRATPEEPTRDAPEQPTPKKPKFRIPKIRAVSPLLDRAAKELDEMKKEKEQREAERKKRKLERGRRRQEAKKRRAEERKNGTLKPRQLTEAQIHHRQLHHQARQQRNEERSSAGQHAEMHAMIAKQAAEIFINRFLAPGRGNSRGGGCQRVHHPQFRSRGAAHFSASPAWRGTRGRGGRGSRAGEKRGA
ncbi:hypothetical protein CAEBREN_02850 [Caenorhabditis brenneri]|uniref:Uncharacterized protein n=1 Tax=Caenorhabditis brenneri TaxID=135651 RepID=G0NBC2_CAEBE|nr:hypothetical protein CAEBREN_02850 [Caenorhabditis brenneri]